MNRYSNTRLEEEVRKILVDPLVAVYVNRSDRRITIQLTEDTDLTFAKLTALSERFSTTAINVRYTQEEPDYSEYTPGDPSRCTVTIDDISDLEL